MPTGTAADTVDGNTVPNVEGLRLEVDNYEGASPVTVTLVTSATVAGYSVQDIITQVPTGSRYVFGRFDRALFGDSVEFTCSAACTLVATR
jgi:hypothetical protein